MPRFIFADRDDVEKRDDAEEWLPYSDWEYPTYLIDTKTDKIIASDQCESEDATFGRHYRFLIDLLNEVAEGD
jgi:hypothetical protein